ncbi:hypothetical protein PHYSODRAFT_502733 [Phytophthora sojae]|uniref:Mediator complex subunit Med12 LCEWAV-domain domain-containing protein n=1 Tax=Phytophthora sojae (strain P6497) TaxID=1094619 RepID=G4ZE59_PHYSP|nr:hypothetical protein PHYSODRAFT_502733 [Phytophthora sojae]EGZ17410.1 hypothetical protein PHYSODRAFT_502733 [Phytophthora sojae]|eukprot:XP_009526468.1 hypothetical protein PHYSODRAFT_502733 [Phytophthora sojae]
MESYHAGDGAGKAGARSGSGSGGGASGSGGGAYKERGSSSHGGRSGGSSGSGSYQSSGRGLPRRGSSNSVGGASSRDRERERDRDRDRDRDRERDRERDRDGRSRPRSRSRDAGGSSRERRNSGGSRSSFAAGSSPAVRLRERKNLLLMHRTSARRNDLTPADAATRVVGMDVKYMKDPERPYITDKLAMFPSVFPTNANFPEEKFRFHALRNAAFVSPLPRGFNQQWHLQYSAFTDKKLAIFDDLTRATRAILRLRDGAEDGKSGSGDAATPAAAGAEDGAAVAATAAVQRAFTNYLMRHVRRIDDRTSHIWMSELASGARSAAELTQAYGVPFKQWRAVPGVSKCPLLEFVVKYRPGYAEATWFVRINVVYTEMRELERDSALRTGDWFFSPRRNQRRNQGWTDKLIDYLHSIARQAALDTGTGAENRSQDVPATANAGAVSGVPAAPNSGGVDMSPPSPLTWHEKWSYVLKLSEYQFKMGLLDRVHYFDGLLSLLQKSLTPRSRSNGTRCSAVLALGVNGIMELISVVQKLLPEILLSADAVLLLVKTVLQHLRYLLPPGRPVPAETTGSALQEEILVALCQLLRDILLNGNDVLVRLEDNASPLWPAFVFTDRFFNRDAYGATAIQACIERCQRKNREVAGRILRLQQACPSLSSVGGGQVLAATMRNEAQILQTLDRFHRVDSTSDLHRVYSEVFSPLPTVSSSGSVSPAELPVDVAALFLVCEWAVTNQRPAEYRYLSALALIEMHSNALLEYGKSKGLLPHCGPKDHQLVLQSALQNFLHRYEPKVITEVTQVIELFCLLVRRRLFSVASFVEFASCCNEAAASMSNSPLLTLAAGGCGNNGIAKRKESAPVVHTAYNIECSPGRGYKSSDIHLLSSSDRLKLYLWQLPRSAFPLPTCVPMLPDDSYDGEVNYLRWLEVMELRREHLSYSKTLERAQSLCIYVFHTHGQANDTPMVGTPGAAGATPAAGSASSGDTSRVMKEVEYQGKVGELVSAVKTMCGHDKGRFTRWFLHNIYEEATFFRFSDYGSVEHVMRLVCLVLEIVDILALLEVLVHFLRRSPCFLVKNVVLAMIERHELAFCATDQIPFLLQSFVDRFHRIPKNADDKAGNVAQFFCRMYYAHIKKKEIAKLDLPFALLKPIAETARKNQDAAAAGVNGNAAANGNGANGNGQKNKELSLEATNPIVRIPPPREVLPPELKSALAKSFKALQARAFDGPGADGKQTPATPGAGSSTPLQSPNSMSQDATSTESVAAFEPNYASLSWQEVVSEATPTAEAKCRDSAIDFAVSTINMSMTSSSVGSTNANATRERRTPNYVFFFRAVLTEAMDKWMANISARIKSNCKRPITTPHYVHRCVRLIREVVEQHPDNGEEFNEKFSNTLVVWLQKEVLPGFAGSDTPKRSRNPFLNADNSKEAFALNQKGRLDRLQYGLKSFLVSLVVHKVLDLSQVLRLVLVPLFPRLRRASRDPPPNLPTQLLAMALVFQLFSEPPQNLLLDPQKVVMFDEPLTKYHLRFLRTQVPACLMFPLCFLLCQISYQMEDNFLLRKREERGTLASTTLFNLTSDGIVRDTIFHDTKEAREKHILPVYHKKQWHTAVLLTHFFRPPTSPAEDGNGQVQLLKVDQIIDQMNVWTLHRGGSIYLDLQMSRQQQKVKRSKRRTRHQRQQAQNQQQSAPNKRKAPAGELSTRSTKRAAVESVVPFAVNGFTDNKTYLGAQGDKDLSFGGSLLGNNFSDGEEDADEEDLELELGFDEASSATEILSSLIVLRTLKRSSRPPPGVGSTSLSSSSTTSSTVPVPQTTSATITTLSSSSPLATPKLYGTPHHVHPGEGGEGKHRGGTPGPSDGLKKKAPTPALPMTVAAMQSALTPCEARMLEAAREAQDSAVASLYAATVCSISRRAMGSVIAKILQILEDDVKHTLPDKFARQLNTTSVVHLVGGIMCTPPGNAFLPRYMMSLAAQLEWLYEGCMLYDKQQQSSSGEPGLRNSLFLRRLRCKLAVRLQLVGVIGPSKHAVLTICYRDRIVKTLFALLGTSVVSTGPGLSLFSWILDLIPVVNASVLHDKQFELVEALQLPDELKRRVWSVLPRPMNMFGAANVFVGRTAPTSAQADAAASIKPEYAPVDPWGLLEHVPQLPSDALVPPLPAQIPKRPRRVFRCV